MAINLISPGVKITESDQVASVQALGTTIGGTAGQFRWGPVEQPTLITSETQLATSFGIPNSTNIVDFLSAASYLAYSPALYVVRANANNALNATANGSGTLVKNDDDYDRNYANNGISAAKSWIAKHPGSLGNALKVSTCPSAAAWQSTLTGSFTVAAGSKTVVGVGSAANTELQIGDIVVLGGRSIKVAATSNTTYFTLADAHITGVTAATSVVRRWEYYDSFDGAPGTSAYTAARGGSGDEMHVVVVDEDGEIVGTRETVLEKYSRVSKGSDAKTSQGASNFYKTVINNGSKWVRWGFTDDLGTNWGTTVVSKTYTAVAAPIKYSLAGGADGTTADSYRILAFAKLANKLTAPVSLVFAGSSTAAVINTIISDVAEFRKDVVLAFSPLLANVQATDGEVAAIQGFADTVTRSTYAVMSGNWKYMYDKYNDAYVWVPCCADIAGAMARIDTVKAPWFSPAGYQAGRILNSVRLAWNPDQGGRDALYRYGINPIITEAGRGTILFGDKTFTVAPGSFSRINVRRLFIVIEKQIGALAANLLFEANDDATRASFLNSVEPYLRTVQGGRGLTDFKVICDASNNTDDSINANEFTADIYIRPVSSINYIQLNFVSVRGAAAFTALG
jgi:phage tail sheath protein FI